MSTADEMPPEPEMEKYVPNKRKKKSGENIRSKQERIQMRREIARLDRLGYNYNEIAQRLNIVPSTVHYQMRKITRQYNLMMIQDKAEAVAYRIDQLRLVRKEAWENFHRAKNDAIKTIEEVVPERECAPCDGTGFNDAGNECKFCKGLGKKRGTTKKTVITTGRLPPTEYLNIVMQTIKAERELLGLDPIKEMNVNGNILMWDMLAIQALQEGDGKVPDEVEQAIIAVEKLGHTTNGEVKDEQEEKPPTASGSVGDDA